MGNSVFVGGISFRDDGTKLQDGAVIAGVEINGVFQLYVLHEMPLSCVHRVRSTQRAPEAPIAASLDSEHSICVCHLAQAGCDTSRVASSAAAAGQDGNGRFDKDQNQRGR
jgi:hypothetical protein